MTKHKLPKSMRKYIRAEKARIRRTISDTQERERQMGEIMKLFYKTTVIPAKLVPDQDRGAGIRTTKSNE